jgi:MFS family permease
MGADPPMWRDRSLRRIMAVTFLVFTSFGLTLSALPAWIAQAGVNVSLIGTVTTAMLMCTIVVQLAVPLIVDKLGVRRALLAGLVLLGAPSPLYQVSSDLAWLVTVSIVRGAGFGLMTVLGSTLAIAVAPAHRRGEAVGLYGLAIAVPTMLAVPLGVVLVFSGWFSWVAWCAALPVVGVGIVLRLTAAGNGTTLTYTRRGWGGRDMLTPLRPSLVLFLVTFAGAGFLTFLPAEPAASTHAAAAVWLFSISAAVSRWRVGRLADRIGGRGLLGWSVVLGGIGLLCVAASLLGALPPHGIVWGSTMFGLGYGAAQNLTLLAAVAGMNRHDVANAIWNMGYDAGTAVGALVTGLLAATALGVPGAFGVAGMAAVVAVFLTRSRRADTATGHVAG